MLPAGDGAGFQFTLRRTYLALEFALILVGSLVSQCVPDRILQSSVNHVNTLIIRKAISLI
jgi:hypothetical protein